MSVIGALLLCLPLAAIVTLPLWADNPDEVARMRLGKG